MDDAAIGRCLVLIRRAVGWRQSDLAGRASVSQDAISRVERGLFAEMPVKKLRRIFEAAGASYLTDSRWRGAQLDRLRDERHAALVEGFAGRLKSAGWLVKPELTYSEYGERGSIDLLGLLPADSAIAVCEMKTDVVSIEAALRKLDEKARLAPVLVRRAEGWYPAHIARILVCPESTTIRRQLGRHELTIRAALPARATELGAWLRDPVGPIGGVWLLPLTRPMRIGRAVTGRYRLR